MIKKLKIKFKGFIIDKNRKNLERARPIFLKNFWLHTFMNSICAFPYSNFHNAEMCYK
jgi:hypothetical protein